MPRHGAEGHELAGPELGVATRGVDDRRKRIDVRDVEAPSEQADERVTLRGRRNGLDVVPDQRHADRAGVEPLRVRTDHVPIDAAAATLVDRPEAVDEKVVADVVPAVSLHVVDLDSTHDRRRLGARVGVRAGGVVNDRKAERRGDDRRRAHDLLVGAPRRARDDRRLAGRRQPCGPEQS